MQWRSLSEFAFASLRATIAFLLLLIVCAPSVSAHALQVERLYSFCAQVNCADGYNPTDSLFMDSAGNLYGTTYEGGNNQNAGVIFELTPAGNGDWQYHLIYTFCSADNCPDSGNPTAPLIIDAAGNLYGTASGGDTDQPGLVFELTPNEVHTKWIFRVLHHFGRRAGDGKMPGTGALTYAGASSGAVYDGRSPLFGATRGGGTDDYGTVFQLAYASGNWRETVLHSFCLQPCPDGRDSEAGLTIDAAGNLYGATVAGGVNNGGTIFELTPNRKKTKWTETVLYSFCSLANCVDGADPFATLIMDAAGNLYGTAAYGGANNGSGVAFKLVPNGAQSQYDVLYNFCSQANCADGATPVGGLLLDTQGSLFGTTLLGGSGNGTVFKIGSGFRILHRFRWKQGAQPAAGLISDAAGNLLGTASEGGANDLGAVFELHGE